jgi:hypothetical protein
LPDFLPDLTQVNFLPLAIAVWPAFLQAAPALGVAAFAGLDIPKNIRETANTTTNSDRGSFLTRQN